MTHRELIFKMKDDLDTAAALIRDFALTHSFAYEAFEKDQITSSVARHFKDLNCKFVQLVLDTSLTMKILRSALSEEEFDSVLRELEKA